MQRTTVTGLALFVVFIIFLAGVQFSTPNLVDNNGYYHIKMAFLMRSQGLKPDFPWLPLTILNTKEFVDHHFLFHVLLAPFTFGDLRSGAKLAAVVYPALAFLAVWWLLRGQDVPFAPWWALGLLAVSETFIYRTSMSRPNRSRWASWPWECTGCSRTGPCGWQCSPSSTSGRTMASR